MIFSNERRTAIPSPDRLCEVRVHLITRQTMRENHRAVRISATSKIEPRVQVRPVTRHGKYCQVWPGRFVRRRIGNDRVGSCGLGA